MALKLLKTKRGRRRQAARFAREPGERFFYRTAWVVFQPDKSRIARFVQRRQDVAKVDLASAGLVTARRVAARWWTWGAATACLLVLLYVHLLMDALMDAGRTRVVIHPPFYPLHRVYLWASTVQWAACLVWLWLTLRAWRGERESSQAGLTSN